MTVEVTDAPFGITVAGENLQVELAGRPEQLKFTASLKPPEGVIVNAAEPVLPAAMVRVEGLTEIVKSGTAPTTN